MEIYSCVFIRRGKEPAYLSSLTGKTPLEQIKAETDMKERELSKQIKIGQRVLVQIKKSSNRQK